MTELSREELTIQLDRRRSRFRPTGVVTSAATGRVLCDEWNRQPGRAPRDRKGDFAMTRISALPVGARSGRWLIGEVVIVCHPESSGRRARPLSSVEITARRVAVEA